MQGEPSEIVLENNSRFNNHIGHRGGLMAKQGWGYDFNCSQSIDAMLAVFNTAGPWQWQSVDSDICGQYVKCRPREYAQVRVYDRRQFRTWQTGDREGFYAELESATETQPEIDAVFWNLLLAVNATNTVET